MNVTYFSLNFPELTQTFVYNEMRGLKNLAVDVDIVALRRPASNVSSLPEQYGFSDRIQYVQADKRRLSRIAALIRGGIGLLARADFRTLWRLATVRDSEIRFPISQKLRIAANLQPGSSPANVIHCHFGPAGRVVAHLKKLGLIKVPMTTVFHGYDITQYTDGRPDIYRELFEQADLLLPISDLWRRRLIDLGAPPEKITTIRLGVDCDAFDYKLRTIPAGQRTRFITIGRMTEKKGHRFTIQAFSQLVSRRPDLDLSLDIVGNGPLFDDMRNLAEASGYSDRIQFHGGLPHQEIKRLLDDAHIFVLPSVTAADGDMEGIPVSIMEAMAMGLPVVSTRHSGIPELVVDGSSGRLVEEKDVAALSSAMEELASSPDLVGTMGSKGRMIIEQGYNEQSQARLLKQALQQLQRKRI
ncbi:glycosyltransferase [Rhizobium binae]|uniref:glycosyltransferase n=1 Tax=Rhizobium binae TaxID=1138190 RepID=UPI001C83AFBC|nr:glycosyltransferase [Rhizobium binae]MBX4950850.1 glycosyltransferase [Rhizobium binae]